MASSTPTSQSVNSLITQKAKAQKASRTQEGMSPETKHRTAATRLWSVDDPLASKCLALSHYSTLETNRLVAICSACSRRENQQQTLRLCIEPSDEGLRRESEMGKRGSSPTSKFGRERSVLAWPICPTRGSAPATSQKLGLTADISHQCLSHPQRAMTICPGRRDLDLTFVFSRHLCAPSYG